MPTDPNWRTLIDESFGDGPGHRPIEERLIKGRRALRRRRIVGSAAAVALAVVAGGSVWAVPSESRSSDNPQVVNPGPDETPAAKLLTWSDGRWAVADGWAVKMRFFNPLDFKRPARSVMLRISDGSEQRLLLGVYDGKCCTTIRQAPPTTKSMTKWQSVVYVRRDTFDVRESDAQPNGQSAPVSFGDGETLVAADGVTIIDQLPHPDLPRNFAGPNDRTAAAWINDNGDKSYVLVRETYGEEQVIPYHGDFDSLAAFVDFARQKYESGVGLL
jgi:hypothetical protein